MTKKEIINLLEETFELEENSLEEGVELDSIEEFDSMGKLSLIVLCDDEFNKKLTGEKIKEFKIVSDIINFLI
jgi:acyl carrier protein